MTPERPLDAHADRGLVAPLWHTAILILVLVGLAAAQAHQQGTLDTLTLRSRLPLYFSMMVFELALLAYVWALGLRLRRVPLWDLIGGKWSNFNDFLRDLGAAAIFWLAIVAVLSVLERFLGANPVGLKAVGILLPQGVVETIAWIMLATIAGFCEEVIFRGYFQRQFLALTGRAELAVGLQAMIFGLAHIYQGTKGALTIAIYGAMFGILAVMRKSLRPGMIQHAGQDIFSGILGSFLQRRGLFH